MNAPTKNQKLTVAKISEELQNQQRQKVALLKTRIMIENRLRATVATLVLGYNAGMPAAQRKAIFDKANKLITTNTKELPPLLQVVVQATQRAIDAYEDQIEEIRKTMKKWAAQLPIAKWVEHPDRRGFSIDSLATIVGETGDLSKYDSPAKVWRRMGCAPWSHNGKTRMGSTWKAGREGKLPAAEWEAFGYNPRRRSVAYIVGENLMKLNIRANGNGNGTGEDEVSTAKKNAGPYRLRYLESKEAACRNHPEWVTCGVCKGDGKNAKGKDCSNCKGTGQVSMRCHLHGLLLAAKLILRDLWREWRKQGKGGGDTSSATDRSAAAVPA